MLWVQVFLFLQLLGVHLSILQEALTNRKIEARSEEVVSGPEWPQAAGSPASGGDGWEALFLAVLQQNQTTLAVFLPPYHLPLPAQDAKLNCIPIIRVLLLNKVVTVKKLGTGTCRQLYLSQAVSFCLVPRALLGKLGCLSREKHW